MTMTLLLNASYEPLSVVSWQRAMTLWAQEKVEIVDTHDVEVRAVTFSFKLPSVVRLLRFVKVRSRRETVPFCRANIYTRDGYQCQYCGGKPATEELTFDHVIPVAQGGRREWENIATACVACNKKKGARTPAEAGMALRRAPRKPVPSPVFRVTLGVRKTPESWRNWLYWNAELET